MGRKSSYANVTSKNTLSFGFPYQGDQHGVLTIRKTSRWGTEVILKIERGQFLCQLDECSINLKFDDGPVQSYSATGPSDHSTTMLFIQNGPAIVAKLRKAKLLLIEATFYQEGSQTLKFDVEGFNWQ